MHEYDAEKRAKIHDAATEVLKLLGISLPELSVRGLHVKMAVIKLTADEWPSIELTCEGAGFTEGESVQKFHAVPVTEGP